MTVDNYISALEKIKLALCEVIGALCAEKFKTEEAQKQEEREETRKTEKPAYLGGYMFNINDCKLRVRGNSFEIRFRKFGYDKSFGGKTVEEAQAKMRKYLREINRNFKPKPKKGHSIKEWATIYLEKYKRVNVKQVTFDKIQRIAKKHVIEPFGDYDVTELKPLILQDYFAGLIADGKGRTAEDVKTFLTGMFDIIVKHNIIQSNPMSAVVVPKHYRKHGSALTKPEEKELLEKVKGSYYEKAMLFMLYSGARGSEVYLFSENDIDYENNVIRITTTKQKDGVNKVYRYVPIFERLLPVLKMPGQFNVNSKKLTMAFKKLMPNHHLHELRHTFTTRCRECGIDNEITSLWTGHTFGGNTTSRVYTHFSMEFLQQEAKKLNYIL